MKRRSALVLALAAAGGCGRPRPAIEQLTIAAGPPGSVYHSLAKVLAQAAEEEWGLSTHILHSSESVDNLRYVGEGRAELGFATVDTCVLARQGDYPFPSGQQVQALAGLFENYLHIVVRADSDIQEVTRLAGRAIATGPGDSDTSFIAIRVLDAARLEPIHGIELSIPDACKALARKEIDVFFALGGVPLPELVDLAKQMPIRLLTVPSELIELQDFYGWSYLSRTIQPGIYQLKSEVQTISIPNVLVVHEELPEMTAYRLTELLFSVKQRLAQAHPQVSRLDERSALATYSVPLHEGAARYYRHAKPLV